MDLLSRLTRERHTATLLVTHDLVHSDTLDETVEVIDGRARVREITTRTR